MTVIFIGTTHTPNVAISTDDPAGSSFVETGEASWYGPGFHGRKTANGERFDTHDLTCAHKTLPFGTILKVTNLGNNRWTIVRVNDRGPYIRGRIIDLSKAAKDEIEMGGTAQVKIEEISGEDAELLKNGIDPNEKIDESTLDTNEFKSTELLDKDVEESSKVFVEFTSDAGEINDFELNKNLKSNGRLKIKVITPKTEEEKNRESNLYQTIENITPLIVLYDLSNKVAQVKGYSLEVGSYSDKSLADRFIGHLERDGFKNIFLEEIITKNSLDKSTIQETKTYKVLVGIYGKKKDSKKDMKKLNGMKYKTILVKIGG